VLTKKLYYSTKAERFSSIKRKAPKQITHFPIV
jgi:hypothetical protein